MSQGWTTSCPDWEDRIIERRSLIPFDPLFPDEAKAALEVFRELRIVDVAGSPTMGEACRPWVMDLVSALFGAYDAATGRRLIRNFFLLVSKKNSKSTIAAGIMMTALIRNWRMSGEFIILAPTIEIANNSYWPCRDMVRKGEVLSEILHVQDHLRTITHRTTGATLKVVAANDETVGGKKAIGVLVDELWQFGKRANAENMLREATGGLASRPEGFVIYLSTQSDEPPAGVFDQKLRYFRDVRDGKISDKRSLPILYEFPDRMLKSERYREPKNFYVTNPNLGASVDMEFLEEKLRESVVAGEASVRGFMAKHLNVEIGLALRSDNWAGAPYWERNSDCGVTLDAILARCDVVTIGIDGGGLDDLLGLAIIGRERETTESGQVAELAEDTRRWLLWTHAWCHKGVLDLRKDISPALLDYEADGDLTIVDRVGDDVIQVADIIQRIWKSGLLPEKKAIGVDPAGIGEIIDELGRRDIDVSPEAGVVVGIPQGWKLNGSIKTCERKLAGGTLRHAGTRLMAWCVGNAKIEKHGNAISVTKQVSGTAKIDPLMATFDAVALMAMNPSAGGSVYTAERGLLMIAV